MPAGKSQVEHVMGPFRFDVRRGQWSLEAAGDRDVYLRHADCRLTVNGRRYALDRADSLGVVPGGRVQGGFGAVRRLTVTAGFRRAGFTWTIDFDLSATGVLFISSRLRNTGRRTLRLGACELLMLAPDRGGRLRLGPRPRQQTVFAFDGSLATQYVKAMDADGGVHAGRYLQHVYNPAANRTMLAGFVTFDRMHTSFECRYDARRRRVDCSGACLFRDHALPPDGCIDSEVMCVELGDDPHAALERWSGHVARHYRPRIWRKPPPVGWVGWAWVDPGTQTPEKQVENNVRAIREKFRGLGVDYLWISIANLKDGLPGNWLIPNRKMFPRGFGRTLKLIMRAGLKPGLWTGFFFVNQKSGDFKGNRGNLLRDAVSGKPLPRGRWQWSQAARDGAEPLNYALDCSHPRSLQYLKKIYSVYRAWGIRYYMLDFLMAGRVGDAERIHDRTMVRGPGVQRRGMGTVRRAAGLDTHLLTAAGSTIDCAVGLADTMRIGRDYGEGRQLQPRFASYPATYLVNASHGNIGSPQENCLQNTAAFFFTHRKLFLNGQNMLTVDHPVPRNEAEFSTTLFGLTGSPVMLGDALDRISDDRLAMLKTILPRPADWPFPADMFRRVYPHDYARVLAVPVHTPWGIWSVVAVFNLDERTAVTDIDVAGLRFPGAGARRASAVYRVWDFWNARYCGCVGRRFKVEVPPRACRLLRLTESTPYPMVLSTDMHVRQGQLELCDVEWVQSRKLLRGKAQRPKGERGNIYLAAPPTWRPADYRGLFVAKDARDDTLIVRKPLVFDRKTVEWSVAFKPLDAHERIWHNHHHRQRNTRAASGNAMVLV